MRRKLSKTGADEHVDRLKAAGRLIDAGDLDGGLFQLRRLQAEGQNDAMILAARMYETGSFGVKRDIGKALKIYEELVNERDPVAFLRLGQLYLLGENIAQNFDQAFYYYSILADAGHATAQFVVGDMHLRGLHAARDSEKARQWFKAAAKNGHLFAAKNIAALDCLNGYWMRGLFPFLYWTAAIFVVSVFRPTSQRLARN